MSIERILNKIAAITDGGNNTALEMSDVLTDITATFSGATIPITNTSDLANDGEDGANPFITINEIPNIPEYTLSPIAGNNIVQLLKDGVEISQIDLTPYLDDTNLSRLVNGTLDSNGILTVERDDSTTFSIDISNLTAHIRLAHTYEQSIPSASWVINHPLDRMASVSVVDSSGSIVFGKVTYISTDTITIDFNAQFSGNAYLT
jgi:hypothetical protein